MTISGEGTHFAQATGTTVKLRQSSSNIYPGTVVEINDLMIIKGSQYLRPFYLISRLTLLKD